MSNHYTWNELIEHLEKVDNCCIDGELIVAIDLHAWLRIQKEWMQRFINEGGNQKNNEECSMRKIKLMDVFHSVQNPERHHPLGKLPTRPSGIVFKG